jgi:lipoate-protein ligase A
MKWFNLNLSDPAAQLAGDEALLDWCENNQGEETLLFWEPRETFVVVGYANKIASEVNVEACQKNGIPIFRRCSGGGTVLQSPGCLNYSLILKITEDGPCRNITSANQFIMERNRAAIASIPSSFSPLNVSVSGHTDLAIAGRKFSGNSQRRKKNFLLFHGCFLLDSNLTLISKFLRMPTLQPSYRAGRDHDDFVTNLNVPADQVKAALQQAWNAIEPLAHFPEEPARMLVEQKYSTDAWNLKL